MPRCIDCTEVMEKMLQDGIIALLAAFGAVTLLWLAATLLLRGKKNLPVVLLVPLRGHAEQMEYVVRSLELQRSRSGGWAPILLVDAGMDSDARRRAGILADEDSGVLLVDASEVANYWG